ncbi:hypothetical protein JTB14_019135 [Gonioctena quinquepunctata]|nr:hypothetical protein JTB14_019135 [Gonioctena quinquepunctata]
MSHFYQSRQDLRSKTKKKKSEQIKQASGTGGGLPLPPKLDITEELILSIRAPTAITDEGNEVVLNDLIYSKEDIIPSSTTASEKKRTVASQRLHTSAVAATTLAEVSRDTLDV